MYKVGILMVFLCTIVLFVSVLDIIKVVNPEMKGLVN